MLSLVLLVNIFFFGFIILDFFVYGPFLDILQVMHVSFSFRISMTFSNSLCFLFIVFFLNYSTLLSFRSKFFTESSFFHNLMRSSVFLLVYGNLILLSLFSIGCRRGLIIIIIIDIV